MLNMPRSRFDVSDVLLMQLVTDKVPTTPDQQSLRQFDMADIKVFTESQVPPWRRIEIVVQIETPQNRQVVIFAEELSIFATALAFMVLEIGYDTFVVCPNLSDTNKDAYHRLLTFGVKFLSCQRFLDESAFSTATYYENNSYVSL